MVLCIIGIIIGVTLLVLSLVIEKTAENDVLLVIFTFVGVVIAVGSLYLLLFTESNLKRGSKYLTDKQVDRNAINETMVKNSYKYPGSEKGPRV